jgi:uncharacterized protein YqfB (UPF0267 family)
VRRQRARGGGAGGDGLDVDKEDDDGWYDAVEECVAVVSRVTTEAKTERHAERRAISDLLTRRTEIFAVAHA